MYVHPLKYYGFLPITVYRPPLPRFSKYLKYLMGTRRPSRRFPAHSLDLLCLRRISEDYFNA
jgi:hypothetical protein